MAMKKRKTKARKGSKKRSTSRRSPRQVVRVVVESGGQTAPIHPALKLGAQRKVF